MANQVDLAVNHAGMKGQFFKPSLDTRDGRNFIQGRNGKRFPATSVRTSWEIADKINSGTDIIGIDEAQFFDTDIIKVVTCFADLGIHIVVAGLQTDFRGEPFGPMPGLIAVAHDNAIHMHAICNHRTSSTNRPCGGNAFFTQRLVNGIPARASDSTVVLGHEESYQPRCPRHFIRPT